ncbi:hypothetical protein F2Q69_00036463 [Brassica cretica]|uniref:Uncharacterized protein n=1 Tax=Brassica cretica TaxID=69181 RepID=A0A8S9SHR9_BRACR|nr:hypothetical protein F2Q69_00036463 [Brassica cretica]
MLKQKRLDSWIRWKSIAGFNGIVVLVECFMSICSSCGVDSNLFFKNFAVGHPNTFGPWDAFRRDLPKIVALRPQEWKDFGRKRIRRQRRCVSNGLSPLSIFCCFSSPPVRSIGCHYLFMFSISSSPFSLLSVDWAANVPCEEPKGKKRLKLPIMGTPSKVYPDYSEILAAQLRDANFGPSVNADGTGSAVVDSSIDRAPVSITVDSGAEGPVDVRPPKKKRKRAKSSKEVRADSPLDGDEREAAQTQLEPMGGDEMEEGDEVGCFLEECSRVEYENALQKMALDLTKAEEMIKIKGAGLEAAKKEKHNRDKELAAERGRYSRERRQAIQAATDL